MQVSPFDKLSLLLAHHSSKYLKHKTSKSFQLADFFFKLGKQSPVALEFCLLLSCLLIDGLEGDEKQQQEAAARRKHDI